MYIEVAVTQAHIDAGERGNSRRCPIALAVKAQWGLEAHAHGDFIDVQEPCGAWIAYRACPVLREWQLRFDEMGAVSPFTFSLDDGVTPLAKVKEATV